MKASVLRGFDISTADIGDRIRFCRPLVSLGDDRQRVYVARKLNWRELGDLMPADVAEAKMLATILPEDLERPISPPQGVVVAGRGFVEAARSVGVELSLCSDEIDSGYRMGLTSLEKYRRFKDRTVEKARNVFDEELKPAVQKGAPLSERGRAAIFLMRKCGPRNNDLAMRQLASVLQDGPLDVYRRLLTGFARDLDTLEIDVQRRVVRYMIQMCAGVIDKPEPRQYVFKIVSPPHFIDMLVKSVGVATTSHSSGSMETSSGVWHIHTSLEKCRRFNDRAVEEARNVFDEELKPAVRKGAPLSERGRAAIFLMRKCGPRNNDLAMRQLASVLQDGPLDVYRRFLTGFARDLDTLEIDVQRRVVRYMIQMCAGVIDKPQPRRRVFEIAGPPRPIEKILRRPGSQTQFKRDYQKTRAEAA